MKKTRPTVDRFSVGSRTTPVKRRSLKSLNSVACFSSVVGGINFKNGSFETPLWSSDYYNFGVDNSFDTLFVPGSLFDWIARPVAVDMYRHEWLGNFLERQNKPCPINRRPTPSALSISYIPYAKHYTLLQRGLSRNYIT